MISIGSQPPVGDAAELALEATSTSFRVGFQIAVPLLVAGMIFRVGMGVLSRLIPQIQVFFVALPLQMMGGLVVFALGVALLLRRDAGDGAEFAGAASSPEGAAAGRFVA